MDLTSLTDQGRLLTQNYALNFAQKQQIASTLHSIDPSLFAQQRALILQPITPIAESYEPCDQWSSAGSLANQERGRQLLKEGKCGCLLVAGGQGSRFGSQSPKGAFPITVIEHKSLFQLICERVLAAGHQVRRALPLAIMTSEENDRATRTFFHHHHYFGLQESQVDFFVQKSLPLLDDQGNLFLDSPSRIAFGPDGNGVALHAFYQAGIWQKWFDKGVRHLAFIQIDNALADPFDAELFGYHAREHAEVSIKAVLRVDPTEKVGVLVKQGTHLHVIEYTEMNDSERLARQPNSALRHPCANLSLFCFEMTFIERVAPIPLPFHLAHKAVKTAWGERLAWKFERFIFDVLPFAQKTGLLVYPREHCFAPLKNREGPDSPQTVRKALLQRDQEVFKEVTGQSVGPDTPLELSPKFYYPTPALLAYCRQHCLTPIGYVDIPS